LSVGLFCRGARNRRRVRVEGFGRISGPKQSMNIIRGYPLLLFLFAGSCSLYHSDLGPDREVRIQLLSIDLSSSYASKMDTNLIIIPVRAKVANYYSHRVRLAKAQLSSMIYSITFWD